MTQDDLLKNNEYMFLKIRKLEEEIKKMKVKIKEFKEQADRCEFRDSLGHKLEMNRAYQELIELALK